MSSQAMTEKSASAAGIVQTVKTEPRLKVAWSNAAFLRVPALLLLFASAAVLESIRLTSLTNIANADVWWHLRTGLWIFQNHGLPHSGIDSQSSQTSWIAGSWAYDLALALGYKLLGLRSLPAMMMCFKVSLAVLTFVLAEGLRGRFWLAMVLSASAQYVLGGVPLSDTACSVLFFGLTLFLLFEFRRSRNPRVLFWLPLLFLLWANSSPQFVYGIALLLLCLAASLIERREHCRDLRTVALIGGLALAASLVTPHFYRPYLVFFGDFTSSANRYFPDYKAMSFHQPQDYLLLLLTMGAFLSLGIRRSRDLFQILLLIGAAILSFHAQRDTWIVTLSSLAILGSADVALPQQESRTRRAVLASVALAVLAAIAAFGIGVPRSRDTLLAKVGTTYPVEAVNYLRQHGAAQPLFNAYEWGGFLMWYQPEIPVAIDGRHNLYNDDFYIQYARMMNAEIPYTAYPAMANARTILLPRTSIMAEALSSLPAFKVAYRDDVSVLLISPGQEQ